MVLSFHTIAGLLGREMGDLNLITCVMSFTLSLPKFLHL